MPGIRRDGPAVPFNRKSFPWTAQMAEKEKQDLPPVPVAATSNHVTWRVEERVSFLGNEAKDANPRKPLPVTAEVALQQLGGTSTVAPAVAAVRQ